MANSNLKIDDRILDELVCGNLYGEEYRQVLNALDTQPDQWRNCAIAFLQEQAIAQELKGLSRSNAPWSQTAGSLGNSDEVTVDTTSNLSALEDILAEPEGDQLESSSVPVIPADALAARRRLDWMQRITSIAALLMISFTVGWFGAGMQGNGTQGSAGNATAPTGIIDGGTGGLAQDFNRNQPTPSTGNRIPGNNLQPNFGSGDMQFVGDSYVTLDREMPAWLRSMERQGRVKVESVDVLMPMELDDGTSAIVPVQQYRVKPVIYSY